MQLSIGERILLLNIFPTQKGDILAIKASRQFRENLSPTPEEVERYNIVIHEDTGQVTWKNSLSTEIDIPEILTERIASVLRNLSGREALSEEHLPLWEKFIGDENVSENSDN